MKSVLAVDPGKMTGMAWWDRSGALREVGQMEQFEFLDWVFQHIHEFDVIVCESYHITQATLKKSRQYQPLEIIGALRWMASFYLCKFKLQSPSDAKIFAVNEKLKIIGWYQPGRDHANDALRHLMLYLVKENVVRPEQLIEEEA